MFDPLPKVSPGQVVVTPTEIQALEQRFSLTFKRSYSEVSTSGYHVRLQDLPLVVSTLVEASRQVESESVVEAYLITRAALRIIGTAVRVAPEFGSNMQRVLQAFEGAAAAAHAHLRNPALLEEFPLFAAQKTLEKLSPLNPAFSLSLPMMRAKVESFIEEMGNSTRSVLMVAPHDPEAILASERQPLLRQEAIRLYAGTSPLMQVPSGAFTVFTELSPKVQYESVELPEPLSADEFEAALVLFKESEPLGDYRDLGKLAQAVKSL